MDFKTISIAYLCFATSVWGQAYYSKLHKSLNNARKCILLEDTFLPYYKGLREGNLKGAKIDITPAVRFPEGGNEPGAEHSGPQIIEVFAESEELLHQKVRSKCPSLKKDGTLEHIRRPKAINYRGSEDKVPEVRKIVDSGDPINRIDVVFMGDGYNGTERERFFSDIDRFVADMFEGETFRSYLPLFNIWAIYVESEESGIGYDGPKNTPFKLYREKGQLRAVFTKNAKYARQICKLTGPHACDFPSLIGNDDYYGGLGGEFVIFTRSLQTGKIVLRHEMGHNFLSAGEEYDNGYAYFGVNSAGSLLNLKWGHWLSGEKKEERAMYRILSYPWVDLNERPVNYTFISNGGYKRWETTVSVTAAPHDDDLEFVLDGQILDWKSTGSEDREFYVWSGNEGLSSGLHNFGVRVKPESTSRSKIPTMICSIAFHEFGSEDEYHKDNTYVSAYPTWNFWRRKTYRPTNAGCVMRNMTHERFCPVCREGMWIQFLSRISLIDDVTVAEEPEEDGTRRVTVKTLQLGQFRPAHQIRSPEEYLDIKWLKNDVEQIQLNGLGDIRATPGTWHVKVKYETPEVRSDPQGYLKSSQRFTVP